MKAKDLAAILLRDPNAVVTTIDPKKDYAFSVAYHLGKGIIAVNGQRVEFNDVIYIAKRRIKTRK